MKVLYFPNVQASLKLRSRKELTEMLITLVVTNASIYFLYRIKVRDIISNFSSHNIDVMFHLQLQLEAPTIPPISLFGQHFMLKMKEFSSFLICKVVEETLGFLTVIS